MDSSIRIERAAAAWLIRRDSGDWGAAEQAEFEAWLGASVAHRVAWLRLDVAWQQSDRLKALGAGVPAGRVPARGAWTLSPFFTQPEAGGAAGTGTALPAEPQPEPGRQTGPVPARQDASALADLRDYAFKRRAPAESRKRILAFGTAASLALMAVLALGWWRFEHAVLERASYATAVGDMRTIVLPDGSQAMLSSGSRMDLAVSRGERQLDLLQGEAFFEVAKDPRRPFVVQAGERRVIAVGTRFSVRRDGDALRVVVTEGKVRLEPDAHGTRPPELLSAGMLALAGPGGLQVQTHPLESADRLLSWRTGYVSFRDTPLAEAVAEFNRYSAHKLVVADPAIAAIPIGGNFRWSNTDAFVRLLEQGFGVRAEHRGDEIALRGQ